MWTYLQRLWTDEAVFLDAMRALIRWGGSALGILMQLGYVPTGIDGGGEKIGLPLAFVSVLLSSRSGKAIEKTAEKVAERKVEAVLPPKP